MKDYKVHKNTTSTHGILRHSCWDWFLPCTWLCMGIASFSWWRGVFVGILTGFSIWCPPDNITKQNKVDYYDPLKSLKIGWCKNQKLTPPPQKKGSSIPPSNLCIIFYGSRKTTHVMSNFGKRDFQPNPSNPHHPQKKISGAISKPHDIPPILMKWTSKTLQPSLNISSKVVFPAFRIDI